MSAHLAIAFAMVLVAGFGIGIQAPVNGALGQHLNSGLLAALVSFGVGFFTLSVLNAANGNFSALRGLSTAPWWMFVGGALGAFAVYSALTNVSKLGALTMVSTILFGQLLAALLIDTIGFGSVSAQALSTPRIMAIFMIGGGIILSRY